ncbi:fumarate hydratase C-terminal domain-containing protein [Chloroflexota bacterium]
MMAARNLHIPLSLDDVSSLKVGDVVHLNGLIFTGAAFFHERAKNGILPLIDFSRTNVLLHVHPMMKKIGEETVLFALGPTSSIAFDSYAPDFIRRLKVRAILGKTTMGQATMKVMQEIGCVHLSRVGSPENTLAAKTKKVHDIFYNDDTNTYEEATLLIEVEDFGPFIVDIDTHGNNLFYQLEQEVDKKMKVLYARFGIDEDFRYLDSVSSKKWQEALRE